MPKNRQSLKELERRWLVFDVVRIVRQAINQLPVEQRTVMEWLLPRLEEGLNVREMATELGLAYATCYERVGRALVALRQTLKDDAVINEYVQKHTLPAAYLNADKPVARLEKVVRQKRE